MFVCDQWILDFLIHFVVWALKLTKLFQSTPSFSSKIWKRIQVGHMWNSIHFGSNFFAFGSVVSTLIKVCNFNTMFTCPTNIIQSQSAIRLKLVILWLQLSHTFRSSVLRICLTHSSDNITSTIVFFKQGPKCFQSMSNIRKLEQSHIFEAKMKPWKVLLTRLLIDVTLLANLLDANTSGTKPIHAIYDQSQSFSWWRNIFTFHHSTPFQQNSDSEKVCVWLRRLIISKHPAS